MASNSLETRYLFLIVNYNYYFATISTKKITNTESQGHLGGAVG